MGKREEEEGLMKWGEWVRGEKGREKEGERVRSGGQRGSIRIRRKKVWREKGRK